MNRSPHVGLGAMFAQLSLSRRAGLADAASLAVLVEDEAAESSESAPATLAALLALRPVLDEAMAEMPHTFSGETVALVREAEHEGKAAFAFDLLADDYAWLERRHRASWAALAYPALLLAMLALLLFEISIFVLPAFSEVFQSFGGDLPGLTRAVLALAPWIGNAIAMLILVFLLAIATSAPRLQPIRRWVLRRLLRWTSTRRYLRKAAEARLARALMHAQGGGLPALAVSRHLCATAAGATEAVLFDELSGHLASGVGLVEALSEIRGLPRRLPALMSLTQGRPVAVEMLRKLAELSAGEAVDQHERLRRRGVGILYAVVAIVIGICVIGLYLPIFRLGTVT